MILIDANQMMIANLFAIHGKNTDNLSINDVRYAVLKGIKYFENRFGGEYGQIVLCYDSTNYWRTGYFPHYKASRKSKQKTSDINWNKIYSLYSTVKEEIDKNFRYISVEVPTLEADDVISAICDDVNSGSGETILIVSSDKDFQQLQRYKNVKQYSPAHRDFLVCVDPESKLLDHIIRGDSSDGIPNVMSDGDTFITEGKKQTIMSSKRYKILLDKVRDGSIRDEGYEYKDNYERNEQLIDLSLIPRDYKIKTIECLKEAARHSNTVNESTEVDYIESNNLNSLLEELNESQQELNI
tara:strand:+ start:502 stop:1395 length:894 start_codon:yes stop_codon:yes gene_type:complete